MTGLPAMKILADDEGLGDPIRRRLRRVTDSQAPLAAAAEQAFEETYFVRSGDDQNLRDPHKHQSAQRIKAHRLVI
jgi:hypothetical protein